MGIKKEVIRRYQASYRNGTFVKGDYIGGETITYNQDSDILESIDNLVGPPDAGEHHIYTYSSCGDGGRECEHQFFVFSADDAQDYLQKRSIEAIDSSGRLVAYSEYDVDELILSQEYFYDDNGNNIETVSESYSGGIAQYVYIERSCFNDSGLEISREEVYMRPYLYKKYKKDGDNYFSHGTKSVRIRFFYNDNDENIKTVRDDVEEGKSYTSLYKYDESHRLTEECCFEDEGVIAKTVLEYDSQDNIISKAYFSDDVLTSKAYYVYDGDNDSFKQTIYSRIEDQEEGESCLIEEYEREYF